MKPSTHDRKFMTRAMELAARGLGQVEPNPMVGAVVVRGGRIVGEGWHGRFGGPHAEVGALQEAGPLARGARLYVSLEPCCHWGKTPPCTDAVIAAGIRHVVAAVTDPFQEVAGKGLAALRAAGIKTTVGVLEEEARRLNAAYFKRMLTGLPLVIAKWAMTLDGRVTAPTGSKDPWISSEESRRRVHEVRRLVDAVIVGAGTVLADHPQLTVRHVPTLPERGQPVRVVLDAQLRVDPSEEPMRSARQVPVLIYTTAAAVKRRRSRAARLRKTGCELANVVAAKDGVSLREVLADLGRRGMSRVLVEGGPHVFGSLLAEGLADRVMIFIAPTLAGRTGDPGPVALPGGRKIAPASILDMTFEPSGPDLLVQGRLGEF
jgi:diaminohydroxyphosphoribosylaminopyrimidine deaminase / 5-amino-6-(5-phosphoribosylamino)uracil reductase